MRANGGVGVPGGIVSLHIDRSIDEKCIGKLEQEKVKYSSMPNETR